jgi:hypothetical protein
MRLVAHVRDSYVAMACVLVTYAKRMLPCTKRCRNESLRSRAPKAGAHHGHNADTRHIAMIDRQPPAVPVRLAHDAVSAPAPVVLHMLRPNATGLARLSMLCDMTLRHGPSSRASPGDGVMLAATWAPPNMYRSLLKSPHTGSRRRRWAERPASSGLLRAWGERVCRAL